MARVTVEDCLEKVDNRFALVILGAERARQLANGGRPLVACNNKPAVTSLREIAKGQVHFNENVEGTVRQFLDEVKARGNRPETAVAPGRLRGSRLRRDERFSCSAPHTRQRCHPTRSVPRDHATRIAIATLR